MLKTGQQLQDKKTKLLATIDNVFPCGKKVLYDISGILLTEKNLLSLFRVVTSA